MLKIRIVILDLTTTTARVLCLKEDSLQSIITGERIHSSLQEDYRVLNLTATHSVFKRNKGTKLI
jgi:hypothetical protein